MVLPFLFFILFCFVLFCFVLVHYHHSYFSRLVQYKIQNTNASLSLLSSFLGHQLPGYSFSFFFFLFFLFFSLPSFRLIKGGGRRGEGGYTYTYTYTYTFIPLYLCYQPYPYRSISTVLYIIRFMILKTEKLKN